jgi:hypothetical protein
MKPIGCRKTQSQVVGAYEDHKMGKAREREQVRAEIEAAKEPVRGRPVVIRFLLENEGGRCHPPVGPRYSTVARFEGDGGEWSIVFDFVDGPDSGGWTTAHAHLLAPAAPATLLLPGCTFELVEGSRLVARAMIVERLLT